MAQGDAPLLVAGTSGTPVDYVVPGSQEIEPLSVHAVFDGSGAAGAFLPAVEIIGPGGVVASVSAMDDAVAAGASVDATWFPGVKGGASVTPVSGLGVPWGYTHSNPGGQSIGSGLGPVYFSVQDTGGSDRFETSDSTVFANASTTLFTGAPVWGIQFNAAGTYMVQGSFFWIAQGTTGRGVSAYWSLSNGSAPSLFQFGRTGTLTGDAWDKSGAAPGLPHTSFYEFFSVSAGQVGGVGALWASVQSGGASTVSAQMMVFKLSDYVAAEL